MFQFETLGGEMNISLNEKLDYELRVWFVYRFLYQNPFIFNNTKIEGFFETIHHYFVEKYTKIMGNEKKAIEEILYLFRFESENVQVINEKAVLELIAKYEINNELLR